MENVNCCFSCSKIISYSSCFDHQTFKKLYYCTTLVGHIVKSRFICIDCATFDVSVYKHLTIACYSCGCDIKHFYISRHGNINLLDTDFHMCAAFVLNKVFCVDCARKVPRTVTAETLNFYVAQNPFGIFANTKSIFD